MVTTTEPVAGPAVRDPVPHRRYAREPAGRPSGRGVVPFGLLGALALAAAVESAVLGAGGRLQDPLSYGWDYGARAAAGQAPGRDVLLVGDSLVKLSLVPRVIAEESGLSSFNLGTAAGPPVVTSTMFRRALDAGARPSAVVFDLKPSLSVGGPSYSVRRLAGLLTAAELVELCLADRSRAFAADLLTSAALPTFRRRDEVRAGVLAALRGEPAPTAETNAVADRNWSLNGGANLATPGAAGAYAGEVTEAQHTHLLSHGFYPHRVNALYTRRLLETARARGVRAYLLLPPFVPALNERRAATGAEAKFLNYVRSLHDTFPELTVLDARGSGYPVSVFFDPVHLDARGAFALSADVAAVLKADLVRPTAPSPSDAPPKRWVPLPAYRERPLPADVEHMELSRARWKRGRRGEGV